MNPKDLKALAEKFRAIADDEIAVADLADKTIKAHPKDADVAALCDRFTGAADGDAVRDICDEVKAS